MTTNTTELRLQLLAGGYFPLPLRGKAPDVLKGWQKKFDTNKAEIVMWAKMWPDATNTGVLTKYAPALDIDVMHQDGAIAIEELVRARYEDGGYVLTRVGQAPKRAIVFRTNEPFGKLAVSLIGPDGNNHKIEFLCDGQQVVVDGIHPETKRPYGWHGGEPGNIKCEDLPYIREEEAHQLINDAADLLVGSFGFTRVGSANGRAERDDGDKKDAGTRADWDALIGNIINGVQLHDSLRDLAASCISKGFKEIDAIEFLRSLLRTSRVERDDRWLDRFKDVHNLVRSAHKKFGEQHQEENKEADWQWRFHGDVDPIDSRPWLVELLVPETGTGLLSGQWGTYKTFVALDLAVAVMTGGTFIKFPIMRKGAVLFLALEGESEVAIRLAAAIEAKGLTGKVPFAWVTGCPRLLDPNAPQILTAMVKQAAERISKDFGLSVALVIVDTMGKAAGYTKSGDENDAVAAKIIERALAIASKETGAFFLGLDHFGKDPTTGTRGSSGKEDHTDIVLSLLGDKGQSGAIANTRLCARKRRSGPNGEEFPFKTKVADMGADKNGTPITTLIIDWIEVAEGGATQKPKDDAWSKSLRLLRQTLMNMLACCGSDQQPYADGPIVRAVDIGIIRTEFYKAYPADGDAKAKQEVRRKAFGRAIKDAQARGLIGVRDIAATTFVWLSTPSQNT